MSPSLHLLSFLAAKHLSHTHMSHRGLKLKTELPCREWPPDRIVGVGDLIELLPPDRIVGEQFEDN